MIRKTIPVLVAGAFCVAAIASSASAQPFDLKRGFSFDPSERIVYVKIPHADVDLGSTAGAQVLLARITRAADAVCGGEAAAAVSRAARDRYADCRKVAIAVAVAKMHSPVLTALASNPPRPLRAAR